MAVLAAPSFHDGSGSSAYAICGAAQRTTSASTLANRLTRASLMMKSPFATNKSGRPSLDARFFTHQRRLLLPRVALDHLVDLPLHRLEIEAGGILHRRIVDRRQRQLGDRLLDEHEAPELAGIELVHVAAAEVVQVLAADRRRAFERILAKVDDRRHVGRHLLARPAIGLLVELELEVVDPERAQGRPAEVEELVPGRRSLAEQQVHLVVAVEMVLVGAVAEL